MLQLSVNFDAADLALIEINHPSPLVQKLIEEIRCLQDEIHDRDIRIDELEFDVRRLQEAGE